MQIGGVPIGPDHPVFVIAELSGNHGGSLERALAIVDAAAHSGATAIKLQTFTADSMTLDSEAPGFRIEDPKSLWFGRTLYDLYAEAATPYEWVPVIMRRAEEQGLLCFSSPFDVDAVEFLDALDVPCFKIASLENNDFALISAAASKGKPLIISTGASTINEIDEAVEVAREAGCREIALLKCTSSYPADPGDIDLRAIPMLRDRYGCEVGYSDHTLGLGAAIAAVAVGASIVEKHFIDNRTAGGVDAAFSSEPQEMHAMVNQFEVARRALGSPVLTIRPGEFGSQSRKRSLFYCSNLDAGSQISAHDVQTLRPSLGLSPRELHSVIGRRLTRSVRSGEPVTRESLD